MSSAITSTPELSTIAFQRSSFCAWRCDRSCENSQLAFQLALRSILPIRLEPGAQRRRCLGSLPIVGRLVAPHGTPRDRCRQRP